MRMLVPISAALALAVVAVEPAGANPGPLAEDDIQQVVRDHAHEIRACYSKHAAHQREATGEVVLSVVVAPEGHVRPDSIEVESPGVRGMRFPRCVADSVSAWKFPQSSRPTRAQFPFHFQITRAPGAGPTS